MIDETFLTTEEVLEYLQVNLRTVYRLIKAGKIPAVRVGRQWRFRKRDIDAWLDSQRPRGGAARPVAAAAPARPAPAGGRPRVLVVDDESSIRDLLTKTLALAESCTGGYIANGLTNVPGASAVLLAGLVTYSDTAKQTFLGVSAETLAAHGAVSAQTAGTVSITTHGNKKDQAADEQLLSADVLAE